VRGENGFISYWRETLWKHTCNRKKPTKAIYKSVESKCFFFLCFPLVFCSQSFEKVSLFGKLGGSFHFKKSSATDRGNCQNQPFQSLNKQKWSKRSPKSIQYIGVDKKYVNSKFLRSCYTKKILFFKRLKKWKYHIFLVLSKKNRPFERELYTICERFAMVTFELNRPCRGNAAFWKNEWIIAYGKEYSNSQKTFSWRHCKFRRAGKLITSKTLSFLDFFNYYYYFVNSTPWTKWWCHC